MIPQIVLDTSVLVSGMLGGTATDVIRRWRNGDFGLIVSEEIVAEYREVLLRPRFGLAAWVVEELLDYVQSAAKWVEPSSDVKADARDPTDNKFLVAAVVGEADWIISSDKDLLDIGEFEGIRITSPWVFLPLL